MISLILATRKEVPTDHSNSTLISDVIYFPPRGSLLIKRISCSTFRHIQLGETN
jgi:hypothetical protein